VDVSGADLQLDSFEELAMPLFDQLYNFVHWLTQNREEVEDLVQPSLWMRENITTSAEAADT
jgi:DNA-directed RNA polymerase specialized sigma24 family protein